MLEHNVAEKLQKGFQIVTATQKLAHTLLAHYNKTLKQQQVNSAPSANIIYLKHWQENLWQQLALLEPNIPTLISTLKARQIWQQIISKDINTFYQHAESLWNLDTTVNQAYQAWIITRQHQISVDTEHQYLAEDAFIYQRWQKQYQETLNEAHWIDEYQLLDQLMIIIEAGGDNALTTLIPKQLAFIGFDTQTPQMQSLIKACKQQGSQIESITHTQKQVLSSRSWQFETDAAQWAAIARWAKTEMNNNPAIRIGVVVPELAKYRHEIERQFLRVFYPEHMLQLTLPAQPVFHVSVGRTLAQYAMVNDLLNILRMTDPHMKQSIISTAQSILSPFISAVKTEKNQRAQLHNTIIAQLPYELNNQQFTQQIIRRYPGVAPEYTQFLTKIHVLQQQNQERKTHSIRDWVDTFSLWLEQLNWPGDIAIDSFNYQLLTATENAFNDIRQLDRFSSGVKYSLQQAISLISHHLSTQRFQIENPDPSISIMSILESGGLSFDKVWWAQLDQNHWPLKPTPSPFIPIQLQVQQQVMRADAQTSYRFSQQLQSRILRSAPEINFSYCKQHNDQPNLPSALFLDIIWQEYSNAGPAALFNDESMATQTFIDNRGLPLTSENSDSATQGGSSILSNQSLCPFRAYAIHRLNAKPINTALPGTDPMIHGILIHRAMRKIWMSNPDSTDSRLKSPDQRIQYVTKICRAIVEHYFAPLQAGTGFKTQQTELIATQIDHWLAYELTRETPFAVIGTEFELSLTLDQLELSLIIDRIDQLEDNSLAIIDYKTGQVSSIGQWFGARPESVQMPIYALALSQHDELKHFNVNTLLFAQIKKGDYRYVGLSQTPDYFYPEQRNQIYSLDAQVSTRAFNEWQEMMTYFEQQLTQLAHQFITAEAQVDPLNNNTCTHCHLKSLCRINENLVL